jgi:hypothetical protein
MFARGLAAGILSFEDDGVTLSNGIAQTEGCDVDAGMFCAAGILRGPGKLKCGASIFPRNGTG